MNFQKSCVFEQSRLSKVKILLPKQTFLIHLIFNILIDYVSSREKTMSQFDFFGHPHFQIRNVRLCDSLDMTQLLKAFELFKISTLRENYLEASYLSRRIDEG